MPRNIIDIIDLSVTEINELIAAAEDIIENPARSEERRVGKECRG